MAEGSVADVVEQGSRIEGAAVLHQGRFQAQQMVEGHPGQVQHPERMGEAAGFSPLEGEVGGAELADPPQPLERGGVDQVDGQGFGRFGVIEADRPMQGIVIRALTHGAAAASMACTSSASACSSQLSSSPPGLRGSGSGSDRSGSMPRS